MHREASNLTYVIETLWRKHLPSKHVFFKNLRALTEERGLDQAKLQRLYLGYQASMHATRAAIYYLPHLDSVDMRLAKLRILADDDCPQGNDSHHAQLRRTWASMLGGDPDVEDKEFGEISLLMQRVDSSTGRFLFLIDSLYRRSLGPWLMVEGLANDWIGALLLSLTPQFPEIGKSDYFLNNFSSGVELRHADEALRITQNVLQTRPELYFETIFGAEVMGNALDNLWDGLAAVI